MGRNVAEKQETREAARVRKLDLNALVLFYEVVNASGLLRTAPDGRWASAMRDMFRSGVRIQAAKKLSSSGLVRRPLRARNSLATLICDRDNSSLIGR